MTLPRYGRERYKNSHNLDILATYTQGMSKSYRKRDNPVVGLNRHTSSIPVKCVILLMREIPGELFS
jgi:hypothetical protein